ncbi:Oidioi.mRNA.OKI2018_I69.YSR.g17073.t1.cds [Oikopleura dioica]|uniref:Oidioi.mRNA.OKI2018_I69.YSR.g17073.t1.cds n=1 Tax=Oikopleura dioica TaxID=34765 RepID=A0ABN7SI46_OIKDI|nr:Oidioi.mRNA.OKI2018_I69.YSR.g17073.t1.cds [Oikopleura dioica]
MSLAERQKKLKPELKELKKAIGVFKDFKRDHPSDNYTAEEPCFEAFGINKARELQSVLDNRVIPMVRRVHAILRKQSWQWEMKPLIHPENDLRSTAFQAKRLRGDVVKTLNLIKRQRFAHRSMPNRITMKPFEPRPNETH